MPRLYRSFSFSGHNNRGNGIAVDENSTELKESVSHLSFASAALSSSGLNPNGPGRLL